MTGSATYARGAAILCLGIAAYIVQDLIMKIASGHYPIHQALALRALTALPIAVLLIYLSGSLKAIKGSTRPMLPRSMLTVICNLTYYLALAALPMATVGALYLSAPLMITALSVLLLQEKVNAVAEEAGATSPLCPQCARPMGYHDTRPITWLAHWGRLQASAARFSSSIVFTSQTDNST